MTTTTECIFPSEVFVEHSLAHKCVVEVHRKMVSKLLMYPSVRLLPIDSTQRHTYMTHRRIAGWQIFVCHAALQFASGVCVRLAVVADAADRHDTIIYFFFFFCSFFQQNDFYLKHSLPCNRHAIIFQLVRYMLYVRVRVDTGNKAKKLYSIPEKQ